MTVFTLDLLVPRRALAVAAHPDDVEFGCGGTLAKWAAQGCSILHLICTDGSKGTWDANADLTQLVAIRQAEQRDAARVLGGTEDVVFLDWHDGELGRAHGDGQNAWAWRVSDVFDGALVQ